MWFFARFVYIEKQTFATLPTLYYMERKATVCLLGVTMSFAKLVQAGFFSPGLRPCKNKPSSVSKLTSVAVFSMNGRCSAFALSRGEKQQVHLVYMLVKYSQSREKKRNS